MRHRLGKFFRWFFRGSTQLLRAQVLMANVIAIGCALGISIHQFRAIRNSQEQNVFSVARVLTHNLTTSLSFNDAKDAEHLLTSLAADENITGAVVLGNDGKRFAGYGQVEGLSALPKNESSAVVDSGGVELFSLPIHQDGAELGRLVIGARFRHLGDHYLTYLKMLAAILAAGLILSILLSSLLGRYLSQPLLELIGLVHQVRVSNDYTLRALPMLSDGDADELKYLAREFDGMLTAIERKDQEIGELNETLDSRVRRRTQELEDAQASLIEANNEATAASRSKSEFLANMSHEIRTPMNGVLGVSELLAGTPLDPRQREYVGVIRQSASALLAIINDILDLSKVEAGKLTLEYRDFALRDAVRGATEILETVASQRGNTLTVTIAPEVPAFLKGDPGRIRQILMNLIGNAIKFTERGRVELKISSEGFDGTRRLLRFAVSDTGVGIPPAAQASLFQNFTQADSSVTRKYGGTGLGLAICKKLTELMGGKIGFTSVEKKGSVFFFTVPLEEGREIVSREETKVPAKESAGKYNLLLVEDNATNRLVASAILERAGFKVATANNGAESLEMLKAGTYHLVLMDCQMPVMDGYEATRRIRTTFPRGVREIPVVALTAHAVQGERDVCLAAGMNDYVSKPFQTDNLLAVVSRWLVKVPDDAAVAPAAELAAAPASEPEPPILDASIIEQIKACDVPGEPSFFLSVVDGFLPSAEKEFDELKAALEKLDRGDARRLGHRLTGSFGTVGAARMAALCRRMEDGADTGSFDELSRLYQSMRAELGNVRDELLRECDTIKGTRNAA